MAPAEAGAVGEERVPKGMRDPRSGIAAEQSSAEGANDAGPLTEAPG